MGGHTAEMINLLLVLQKDRFSPRFCIAAAIDNMSLQKARVLEDSLADSSGVNGITAVFVQIYRTREVGQSYVTSVWTTLIAMAYAFWLITKIRLQVLCNGPGNCIPLCVTAFFFKVVGIRWSFIFYVESIATVKKAFFKWFVALQVMDCRSVLCAMATAAKKVPSSSLCWLPDGSLFKSADDGPAIVESRYAG